jgi:transposase-like protein
MDSTSHTCPLCGSEKTLHAGKELYRCRLCGCAFNEGYSPLGYGNDYFIDEYRSQYGRTYEEDFVQIYSLAQTRIRRILTILSADPGKEKLSILDIGSALGFSSRRPEMRVLTVSQVLKFQSTHHAIASGISILMSSTPLLTP